MIKKLGALAAVGALAVALMTGCDSHQGSGQPKPGDSPKAWCPYDSWIDRATWDYAYWQEGSPHDPATVAREMGYGHRLMDLLEQDRQTGKLPSNVSDDALKTWALNLAHVQGGTTTTAAAGLEKGGLFDNYLSQVHAACN